MVIAAPKKHIALFLNIVTDDELLTSQIVKTILLLIIGGSMGYNLFRVVRADTRNKKIIILLLLFLLSACMIFVSRQYRVEAAMLKNPRYVQGTTIGYCSVFAEGQGIEFEYKINGVTYRCCNTFHPVSKESLVVPGGKYKVRYAESYPNEGRMMFKKN